MGRVVVDLLSVTLVLCFLFLSPAGGVPRRGTHHHHQHKKEEALEPAVTLANPLVPLEFWEKAKRKPRRKNLKLNVLLKKMGEDFDPRWMATEEPPMERRESVLDISDDQVAELVEQLSTLNLNSELASLLPANSSSPEDIQAMSSLLQKWLLKKSSCPVTYSWVDLGEYFWPRWIRKGSCHQERNGFLDKKPPCSWPRGLVCVPGEALPLQILRWHCKRRRPHYGSSRRNRPLKCKWYKVPYPITSSCKCDCKAKKH